MSTDFEILSAILNSRNLFSAEHVLDFMFAHVSRIYVDDYVDDYAAVYTSTITLQ